MLISGGTLIWPSQKGKKEEKERKRKGKVRKNGPPVT